MNHLLSQSQMALPIGVYNDLQSHCLNVQWKGTLQQARINFLHLIRMLHVESFQMKKNKIQKDLHGSLVFGSITMRLWKWFLAVFHINDSAVCEMSMGVMDYHNPWVDTDIYITEIENGIERLVGFRCRRCGKEIRV